MASRLGTLPSCSPLRGRGRESEYFALETNRRVEFSHGFLEFLPMPTVLHQRIAAFLYDALQAFVVGLNLGEVLFTGVRVRLWPGKFREPDVLFMRAEHAGRITEEYWEGADLVMEVVSSGDEDRRRDLKTKREEYAQARIPEYWIVDPELEPDHRVDPRWPDVRRPRRVQTRRASDVEAVARFRRRCDCRP